MATYTPTNSQTPTLGQSGPSVLALQQKLNAQNAGKAGWVPLKEDALFGPKTQAALNFQSLQKSTPSTNAGQINQVGNVNMPVVSPYTGGISGATAATTGMSSYFDTLQKQQADYQSQLDTANATQSQTKNSIFDFLSNQKSQSQLRNDTFAQIGYDPVNYFAEERAKIAEIGKLSEDYNKVIQARDEQIAAASGNLASNNFINNQIAQINRNAAPKLNAISANVNAKTAVLQALQGNFAEANKFVNEAVDAATADAKFKLDTLQTFYTMNQDVIDRLDKKYQNAFDASLTLAKDQYDYERDIKKMEYKEMLDAATGGGGGGGGLTPAQINSTVNSIAGALDNEPIVKSYNTVQDGYQTIRAIGTNTSSPADDIAFIYAFAKIMDPNSVVREGEYNTIQKYAQTWANNFGFSAKRIFSNTNFLTPDAKQKMLNALQPKVNTITSQYNQVRNEYQRQINDAYQGKPRQLTQYTPSSFSDQTISPQASDTPATKGFFKKLGGWLFGSS